MRLSIFARLIISYLVLFSMLTGVSLYFIYHVSRFNQATRSIILNDTSTLENSRQLSDILLSESRYDRKYAILKDEELYENYLETRDEFNQLLNNTLIKTNSQEIKDLFSSISIQHKSFNYLVNDERELIRTAQPYSSDWYAAEKKKIADAIIEKLNLIRRTSEKKIFTKITNLSERGDKARNVSIIISIFALSTGLIVAFIITMSIKKPLDVMKAKTIEISQGNFKGDLDVKSPPVIAQLATAINTMCHKLQEMEDIKSDFFSHMSHELRTPLTSIKEGTAMLLEGLGGEISEKQQRILKIVVQECNRLINLVNSLLDLSKMEAGMLSYNFEPTELSALVKKTLDILAPLAESKNISIENTIGTLQAVQVDQERMQEAFRNIIGNAIKFTPENGNIKIEANVRGGFVDFRSIIGNDIKFTPEKDNIKIEANVRGSFVEIAIHDTGIGIPEEDLGRLFLKFQQITPAKSEKIKGTGLGLATVKQIILAHGGKVWATSQTGLGSTFYITLPLAA